jgi:hypothetical protein
MKTSRILILGAALLVSSSIVQAHTHLEKAVPADNSVLADPPSQIMLHFSEATRLTALSIQKEGDEESAITSVLPKESAQALTVPITPPAPGTYLISWRAIGKDKHVMSGTLHFTVTGE